MSNHFQLVHNRGQVVYEGPFCASSGNKAVQQVADEFSQIIQQPQPQPKEQLLTEAEIQAWVQNGLNAQAEFQKELQRQQEQQPQEPDIEQIPVDWELDDEEFSILDTHPNAPLAHREGKLMALYDQPTTQHPNLTQ